MTSVAIASINMDGGTQPPSGTVYAIRRGYAEGPVKIGFTGDDVYARIRSLQTGSPEPLVPMGTAEGTQQDERALHAVLDDFRMVGEWFFPAKKVLLVARNLADAIASVRPGSSIFPELPDAILTSDGFIRTADMTQLVMARVVADKRRQAKADRGGLDAIEQAHAHLSRLWSAHPNLTTGQLARKLLSTDWAA